VTFIHHVGVDVENDDDDARAGGSRERAERGATMRRRGARRCEETHDGYALET